MLTRPKYWHVLLLVIIVARCAPATRTEGLAVPPPRPFSTHAVLTIPACPTNLVAADSAELVQLSQSLSRDTSHWRYVLATTRPGLRNAGEIRRALVREYPADLRDRGLGGTTVHRVLLDQDGRIADAALIGRSGYSALDAAARKIVAAMTFFPATYDGCRVAYIQNLPVVFTAR